jgi:NDP-sugar pyrophosphorylase family protein
LVESDPAFWVLYSEVLTNTSLMRMAEFHARHNLLATVGLYRVPDPSRCSIANTKVGACFRFGGMKKTRT